MKIAIIGTGISGLTSAYLLSKETNKNKDRDENKVIKSEETVKVEETPKTQLSTPDTPKNIPSPA